MRAGREGSRERGRGKDEQRRAILEDKFQVEDLIMNDDESPFMMVICDLIKIMKCLFS